jgi:hypothetical protein
LSQKIKAACYGSHQIKERREKKIREKDVRYVGTAEKKRIEI